MDQLCDSNKLDEFGEMDEFIELFEWHKLVELDMKTKIIFCWNIIFCIFIMFVWKQGRTISLVFYGKWCYFKIMPMVVGGEVDWATRCSQCNPSVSFMLDFQ